MEEKVKQRLIGVIVIVGALFIILPFLFHNPRPSAESKVLSSIAATPSVSVTLPQAASTTTTTAAATTQPTQLADQTTTTATTTQPTDQTTNAAITTTTTATQPTDQTTNAPTAAVTTTTTTATQPTDQTANAATATTTTTTATQPVPANALTSGQTNEGPVQPAVDTSATPAASEPTSMVKKPVAAKKPAAKSLSVSANTHAWEIQVAVFSDKTNANHLMAKLRGQDYQAYSRRVTVNNRSLVAVFVGPEINLNKAELIKQHLQRSFQLNGEVKKYQA